ncbi:MAG: hypothetical protein R6V59_03645 [Dehalococcoidia bacterium]
MKIHNFCRLILVIFLVFVIGLVFPNQSEARTTVVCEDCDIRITVYLAFAFLDDVSWMNAQQLVDIWVAGMLKIWNEPDFTYGFCECPVHFEVVVDVLPKGEDCMHAKQNMPGWHCVNVVNEPTNQRGNVADAHEIPPNTGDGFGEWSTTTTGMQAAHEVGHFMGLGDEYRRDENGNHVNTNPQPEGQAQSIMAQTWGEVAALQSHIDDIIGKAGIDCPMPECCCGNGELDSIIGEECDYTADPTGCPAGQVCDSTCHCVPEPQVTPRCGDGVISPPHEECDPNAEPTGCAADEECIECKCQKKEEEPPPEEETAKMHVSPELLDFGIETEEESFIVKNVGGAVLCWEIIPDLPEWMNIIPISGNLMAGEEETIWVNVSRVGLPPNIYEHTIFIVSDEEEKSVLIIMFVEEIPE